VGGQSLAESAAPHGPGLSRQPVAGRRAGAYRTMIGFPLFAVIAAVVDWSRFRCA
jgi:hypothetical protein